MEISLFQFKFSSILNIPFHTYENDFSFLVNGRVFATSRIFSDILSPVISRIHSNDPTIDTFTINTAQQGDFSYILNLISLNKVDIPENELPFISEVIQILGIDSIDIFFEEQSTEITNDNVFSLLQVHERYPIFYSRLLSKEVNFVSMHFYDLCQNHNEQFLNLSLETLDKIINNDQIQLNSEDQLLQFINQLYRENSKYSVLYEYVHYVNVSSECIREFVSSFNVNDMTTPTWISISKRLEQEIKKSRINDENINRYVNEQNRINEGTVFSYSEQNLFKGILNHLRFSSKGFEESMSITADTYNGGDDFHPRNVILYEDQEKIYHSSESQNNWIRFEFKKNKVIPSHYTIRSWKNGSTNSQHPKSWVIEGSNDTNSWEILDEQNDCPYLNGQCYVHTFPINNQILDEFKFIRMRLTGPSWSGHDYLRIEAFEIYGRLV